MTSIPPLRRVEMPDLGFVVHVPADWREYPPDLNNSLNEVARFGEQGASFRRNCLVLRFEGRGDSSVWNEAEKNRSNLEEHGFEHFTITDDVLAGARATRVECEKEQAFGRWYVRSYLTIDQGVLYGLSTGTTAPSEDAELVDEMARRFELMT